MVANHLRQFSADGASLVVGETWAGRVTRWNATSGAYLGLAGTFLSPMGVVQCGAGATAGVAATELLADRFGEVQLHIPTYLVVQMGIEKVPLSLLSLLYFFTFVTALRFPATVVASTGAAQHFSGTTTSPVC